MDEPALPARWKVGAPLLVAETFSSRIWKVERQDGSPAIVKDLKPFSDVEDELRGVHLLAWRRGEGLVRLYGRDGRRMLIEYAGNRLLAAELADRGDRAALEIAADVLARLLSPSKHAVPPGLQPLAERFASLFRLSGVDGIYAQAAQVATRLLADQRDVRPLHGDLHHDNIVQGSRGWLAIDPKGLLGDPAFDAANLFYNPLDRDDLCLDPQRIAFAAALFARTLKREAVTILDHAFAYGCLSAAWHREDGNEKDERRELAVAAAIRTVRGFSG